MKIKFYKLLLSLVMVIGMVFQAINPAAIAQGNPQTVDTTITDFRIEKPKGTAVAEVDWNDSFYIAMDWKVTNQSAIVNAGDYFDITLPNNMRFPSSFTITDFDLTDENNEVIARAHVTSGNPNNVGGTIRVTFNDKINGKYNVKGTMYLGALFNKDKIKANQPNQFDISVSGKTISKTIKVKKVGTPSDQILTKWGEREVKNGTPIDKVKWYANVNYRKSNLINASITDELSGNETYITDSFSLKEVEFDDNGNASNPKEVNLAGKLTFGAGNKSFKIDLGSPGTKQYRLSYITTYTPGTVLKNKLKIAYDGDSVEVTAPFQSQEAGGTAGGELASKIKLIKVDHEDNQIPLADVVFEVTAPDGHKFELKTGADGTIISEKLTQGTYKVKEKVAPKGYVLDETEYTLNVTPAGGAIQKITNKRIKININGEKIWKDNDNKDKKRPTSIKVKLFKKVGDNAPVLKETKDVKEGADKTWKWTFENLDKYENGKEITYTVEEEAVGDGYAGVVTGSMAEGFKITNTYTPTTTEVKGEKIWKDNNNQDGKRPEKINVILKKTVNGQTSVVTKKEVKADNQGNWKYEFTNLPKLENGKEITYSIDEDPIPGYEKGIHGYNLKNCHAPEKTKIKGEKTWEDNNNQDGKRPEKINVILKKTVDGQTSVVTTKEVKADNDGNWKYEFSDLPKYEGGKEITYSIDEDPIPGYEKAINGYNLKNCYKPEKVDIAGTKTWDDANNQDGKRPAKLKVILKKTVNGQTSVVKEEVKPDADGNWKYEFKNLPKYEGGKLIEYSIDEESVEGYVKVPSRATAPDYNLTNKHTPEEINIAGTKTWDDANNQDGKRPEKIKVILKKTVDGQTSVVKEEEVKADAAGNWKYEFKNLPKYEGGKEIKYSIEEESVEGYTTEIKYFNITNKHTPEKTSVEGTKTWDDANNQDGKRPTKIKVILNKKVGDGQPSKVAEKEVTQADGWKWKFENLDKYEKGQKIEYVVTEEPVKDYTTEINKVEKEDGTVEFNIINKHIPEKVLVSGTKTWIDNNNAAGKRPGSIKVILNKTVDGKTTKVAEKEVTAKDNWNYAFNDLPKYENGKLIKYSIDEVDVPGYEKSIKGHNLENKYIPPKPKLPKTGSAPGEVGGLGVLGLLAGYVLIRRKNKAN
ncbi:Cna B-type domain-containing protein [Gemella morbillorum]